MAASLPAFSAASPALHLALPGLCWPDSAMRDLVFDLSLPALATLLGKGRLQRYPVPDSTAWLGALAGLEAAPLPVAALRLRAAGAHTDGNWLCLDPVHLRIEKTQLILTDPAELELSSAEAEALAASLRPLLDELGSLHLASAGSWHLQCHATEPVQTTPLPDAIGLNADMLMPQAANVRIWRRVLNEVQMTLHAHPVNAERSARGLPVVNSLWPWGEGALPAAGKPGWTHLYASHPMWQGAAAHLGHDHAPEPTRYLPAPGRTLVISEALATPTRMGDAMRWREAMQQLETDWFAPLRAAWQAGTLHEIGIHGSGAGQGISCVVSRHDRWRFWRQPAPLTVLGVQA